MLFRSYDSVFGRFQGKVRAEGDCLVINGKHIKVFSESEPEKIPMRKSPWKRLSARLSPVGARSAP